AVPVVAAFPENISVPGSNFVNVLVPKGIVLDRFSVAPASTPRVALLAKAPRAALMVAVPVPEATTTPRAPTPTPEGPMLVSAVVMPVNVNDPVAPGPVAPVAAAADRRTAVGDSTAETVVFAAMPAPLTPDPTAMLAVDGKLVSKVL